MPILKPAKAPFLANLNGMVQCQRRGVIYKAYRGYDPSSNQVEIADVGPVPADISMVDCLKELRHGPKLYIKE